MSKIHFPCKVQSLKTSYSFCCKRVGDKFIENSFASHNQTSIFSDNKTRKRIMGGNFESRIKIYLNRRFLRGFPYRVYSNLPSRVPRPW
ncbi:hypothetical protein V6Z11_A11G116300 [Gossypium hirsutum]